MMTVWDFRDLFEICMAQALQVNRSLSLSSIVVHRKFADARLQSRLLLVAL